MNLQEFISKFASQFEDEDPSVFTADTDYHELDSCLIGKRITSPKSVRFGTMPLTTPETWRHTF